MTTFGVNPYQPVSSSLRAEQSIGKAVDELVAIIAAERTENVVLDQIFPAPVPDILLVFKEIDGDFTFALRVEDGAESLFYAFVEMAADKSC